MTDVEQYDFRPAHIVVGIIYVIVALIFWIGDAVTTATVSLLCSDHIVGVWTYYWALGVGLLLFGVSYIVAGVIDTTHEQINRRYRPWRWVGHAFLMFAVFQILLHVLQYTDATLVWLAPIIAGVALAYVQSSNETMNSIKTGYAKVTDPVPVETFWTTFPRIEGWITGLLIVGAFWVLFFIRVFDGTGVSGGPLAYSLWILIGYTLFHGYIAFTTTFASWATAWWREVLFIVLEFVLIVAGAYLTIMFAPALRTCVPP